MDRVERLAEDSQELRQLRIRGVLLLHQLDQRQNRQLAREMPRHLRSRLPNERQTLARDQSIDESGKFQRTFGVVCDLGSLVSGRLRGKPHSQILKVASQSKT